MFLIAPIWTIAVPDEHDHEPEDHIIHGLQSHGISFMPNYGQWPSVILYRAEVNGLALFAEQGGLTFSKLEDGVSELVHERHLPGASHAPIQGHAWNMRFVDADPSVIVPAAKKDHYISYFLGNEPSKWASEVPCYGDLTYRSLWPGVDLRLYSEKGLYKYDLLLAPGANSERINFAYDGLEGMSIDESGQLVLQTSVGNVLEMQPVAWYGDGANERILCNYELNGAKVGFSFGAGVDHTRPIVIDPVLLASTLSGTGDIGTTSNYGHAATFDDQGNIYTGARCFGQGYPATTGAFQTVFGGGAADVVISKLNGDGSALIFATYLGGSDSDLPHSLFVNTAQEIYVMSSSSSPNYPVSSNAFDPTFNGVGTFADEDLVITHLDQAGSSIIGSTYVGGSGRDGLNGVYSNYGDGFRGEIIVDDVGNCIVATSSNSADFPTTAGAAQATNGGGQDAVLLSLDPTLSTLLFSTFLGGSGDDAGYGVVSDGSGGFFVCGSTEGDGFPTTAGAFQTSFLGDRDAFLAHVTGNATVIANSTFFGTPDMDQAFFVDTDLDGDVFIYGESEGVIPITPAGTFGVEGDGFVAKFLPDLSSTLLTTEIGTENGNMAPIAFLVDLCGNIYLSSHDGTGGMADGMPLTPDALQTSGGFYLGTFEPDMSALIFGTYYGGNNDHVDGGTSRFDKNGIVYQGVCTNNGFNTTTNAYSGNYPSGYDIGVFKIDFGVAGVNAAGASALNAGCTNTTVDFSNGSSGDTWLWDFGDGSAVVEAFEPSHIYTDPGEYTVSLIALDSLACNLADTLYFPINIFEQLPVTSDLEWSQVEDCTEMRINAVATSSGTPPGHIWQISDGTTYTTDSITHVFDVAGMYDFTLIAIEPNVCTPQDTLVITVLVAPLEFDFDIQDRVLCENGTVVLDASGINGDPIWSTGAITPTITVDEVGDYWVTVSNAAGCVATDTVLVVDHPTYDLSISEITCPGVSTILRIPLSTAVAYLWDDGSTQPQREVEGEARTYVFTVIDEFGCSYTDSAHVSVLDSDVQLYTPNAFSPNGDGVNDTFLFQGYGDRTLDMTIYDRWGEQLYQTISMDKPWDGTYNGQPVKNDVYVYVLKYTGKCTGNEQYERMGHVTVVR